MRLTHKTYVELNEKEVKALKDAEEIIFNLAAEFREACERKGEIEDEALEECEAYGIQLLKTYHDFVYALKTYGNFK